MNVAYLIYSFILPPGINILLVLLGTLLLYKHEKVGIACLALGLISLYLLSTAVVAKRLIAPLQIIKPLAFTALKKQDLEEKAIVVLTGGGRYAPEYPHEQPSAHSLIRENYAAILHRKTHLPIIISGGKAGHFTLPEAKMMQANLKQHFNIPTYWLDIKSRNTRENARYMRGFLQLKKWDRFYLVTSAFHMPRAIQIFKNLGMQPTPAPTDYIDTHYNLFNPRAWLPQARMLMISSMALHEYVGNMIEKLAKKTQHSTCIFLSQPIK